MTTKLAGTFVGASLLLAASSALATPAIYTLLVHSGDNAGRPYPNEEGNRNNNDQLGAGLSVISTLSEANSKLIHVTAQVVQQSFIGDLANPQLGDRLITNVDLFDDNDIKVGTGAGVCTIFSVPPLDTLEECLLMVVFAEGQITLGGVVPLPTVGASAEFGILGGTGDFSKARGEGTLVVTEPGVVDTTLTLK